tara:strand:- start:5592 stop:6893 length:1302 start_codon:yes stop_codon:yes gene_type:complete
MSKISQVNARQILDSRGNPTVEVDVQLENNLIGRAAVPSGASTGQHEAIELRDKQNYYMGRSVYKAVKNVNSIIANHIKGMDVLDQESIDCTMIALDGTENKNNLGANAILGVSMAAVRAAAKYRKESLFEFLHTDSKYILPTPMMNILNGGSHADNNVDIQEFMIYPYGASSFSEAIQMGVETFHYLKSVLKKKNYSSSVGDEGGFAPNLKSNEEAIELILEAIHLTNYNTEQHVAIALDVASTELYNNSTKTYDFSSIKKSFSSNELIQYYVDLCNKYPIISIEDGLDENDWDGWTGLQATLGTKVQLVGDDLTVTSSKRLQKAIDTQSMNAILIKLNQIGTVSETLATINLAKKHGLSSIISHRSGETEDTFIADLSVATNSGQIKTGAPCRTDRVAKYNQLLRIEEKLSKNYTYAGSSFLGFKKNKIEN